MTSPESKQGLSRSEHLGFCDDLIEHGASTLEDFQFLRWEVSRLEGRCLALRRLLCHLVCIPPNNHHIECMRTTETLEVPP